MSRIASIERKTAETTIRLRIDLDGSGKSSIHTGVGFFDHMLTLFAKHGCFDLEVAAQGDLQVDQHHTVEDVGICLGQTFRQALGDKTGIRRYGHFTLPMEETLTTSALDLSGRAWFVWRVEFATEKIGDFDTELVETFFQSLAANAEEGASVSEFAEIRGIAEGTARRRRPNSPAPIRPRRAAGSTCRTAAR